MNDLFATVFGSSPAVFIGITLVFMGGCAFMIGQATASTWRPAWQTVPFALLLGLGDRFLIYALFHGRLLSLAGYVLDATILLAIALLSYRMTRARQMAHQYPWLYERTGPLSWRARSKDK